MIRLLWSHFLLWDKTALIGCTVPDETHTQWAILLRLCFYCWMWGVTMVTRSCHGDSTSLSCFQSMTSLSLSPTSSYNHKWQQTPVCVTVYVTMLPCIYLYVTLCVVFAVWDTLCMCYSVCFIVCVCVSICVYNCVCLCLCACYNCVYVCVTTDTVVRRDVPQPDVLWSDSEVVWDPGNQAGVHPLPVQCFLQQTGPDCVKVTRGTE